MSRYNVFVRTSDLDVLREADLPAHGVGNGLATARATAAELRAMAQLEAIMHIRPARTYRPMNDVARGVTGVQAVQEGRLGREYTGDGVLACIIDTGIDWAHRDFRTADAPKKSRIRAIWDQTLSPRSSERSPAELGYGVEYTRRDIENELDGTPAQAVRSTDTSGHGTHVAGTIAGNGAASPDRTHRGMAPAADIVAVKTDFTGVGIADGITYCGAMAKETEQPVVVNLSLGSMAGPHDGSSALAQVINDFVGAGRSVVVAAGNSGDKKQHVANTLSAGAADSLHVQVPRYSPRDGARNDVAFWLDTWISGTDRVSMTVTSPSGTTIPLTPDSAASVQTPDGTVEYEQATAPNGDQNVEIRVLDADATTSPEEGTWTVGIENEGAARTVHGWLTETTTTSSLRNGDRRSTLTTPATAQHALSVGAWTHRRHWQTGAGADVSASSGPSTPASFSGRGPLRGEGRKPDLVGPGQSTVSAHAQAAASDRTLRGGNYSMLQGTSTAAATTTGAVALLFEEDPSLGGNQVAALLRANAGTAESDRSWTPARGHGQLNLYQAMADLTGTTVATRTQLAYDAPVSGKNRTEHPLGRGGAEALAVRFTPSQSGLASGLYLHTAAGSANQLNDSLAVEIWSDDGGRPGQKLGSTVQIAPDALGNHTMNLVSLDEAVVVVRQNTDYHVVIKPRGNGTLALTGERRSVDGRSSVRRGGQWRPLSSADLALRVTTAMALNLETPQLTAPTSGALLDATEAVSLSWSEASDAASYTVHVSPSASFPPGRTDTIRSQTTTQPLTTLAPSTTYHWRVRAERFEYAGPWSSTRSFVLYPSTLDVRVERSFDAAHKPSAYRLVALPGRRSFSLSRTLDGKAGETWQAFWETGTEDKAFVPFRKDARFQFRPGTGFWLRSDRPWTVRRSVPTVPLSEDGTYTIDLHEGWNVISNPFELDVSWGAVEAANDGALRPLWRYDGRFETTSTFASAQTGTAFYLLNDTGREALRLPYPAAPNAPAKASPPSDRPPALTLTAHQHDVQTAQVHVGLSKAAEDGRDALDEVAPPARFAQTTLRLQSTGRDVPARQRQLAAEYRSAQTEGHTFSLVLRTKSNAPVKLRAEGLDVVEGKEVVLIDPSAGTSHDLRTTSSVTIRLGKGPRYLRLLVGSSDYVEAKKDVALPSTLRFLPNYPNPFSEQTTLEYVLPDPASVRLAVYDVLGRQVRVLVDGKQDAGRHTVLWNGRDESGEQMASGVYLARLVVGSTTKVRKITFVR